MTKAEEMAAKSEQGMFDQVMKLIEHTTSSGAQNVNLAEYDTLWLSDTNEARLKKDGFKVNGQNISWGNGK